MIGDPTDARAKSNLEIRFYRFLEEHGFPTPLKNVPIDTGGPFPWEADCYWPKPRLIVEVMTHNTHTGAEAFYRDLDKHDALRRCGYEIVYVTDRDLDSPWELAERLRPYFLEAAS